MFHLRILVLGFTKCVNVDHYLLLLPISSWAVNEASEVCKLYMSGLYVIPLILSMFEVSDNIYLSVFKWIVKVPYLQLFLNIFQTQNCNFWELLRTRNSILWLKIVQNLIWVYLFWPKKSRTGSIKALKTRKWFLVGS